MNNTPYNYVHVLDAKVANKLIVVNEPSQNVCSCQEPDNIEVFLVKE